MDATDCAARPLSCIEICEWSATLGLWINYRAPALIFPHFKHTKTLDKEREMLN